MRSKWVIVLLVGVLGAAVYGGIALATPPHGVTNPLLVIGNFAGGIDATAKTDIDPGKATDFWQFRISAKGATDVHVLENVIAPGGSFGWHSHPGPSLVTVKSGTLSVYQAPDCTPQGLRAGVAERIDIRRPGPRPPHGSQQQRYRCGGRLRRLVRPGGLRSADRRVEPEPEHLPQLSRGRRKPPEHGAGRLEGRPRSSNLTRVDGALFSCNSSAGACCRI